MLSLPSSSHISHEHMDIGTHFKSKIMMMLQVIHYFISFPLAGKTKVTYNNEHNTNTLSLLHTRPSEGL